MKDYQEALKADLPLFANIDELQWRGPTDRFAAIAAKVDALAFTDHIFPELLAASGNVVREWQSFGDWKTVRGWWRRLVQPSGVHEEHRPEPVRVLEVRAEPQPALLLDEAQEVRLAVLNRRGKAAP